MASTEIDEQHGTEIAYVHEPVQAPSARFGWSGESRTTFRVAGILSAILLLAMLIGNQTGKVEDLWLIALAVVILAVIGLEWFLRNKFGQFKI